MQRFPSSKLRVTRPFWHERCNWKTPLLLADWRCFITKEMGHETQRILAIWPTVYFIFILSLITRNINRLQRPLSISSPENERQQILPSTDFSRATIPKENPFFRGSILE